MFGVITGACGGLGSALVKKLIKDCYLLLIDKNVEKLKTFKKEFGEKVFVEVVDFSKSDKDRVENAFKRFYDKFGRIDFVINCIGACWWYPIEEMPNGIFEDLKRLI